MYVMVPKNCSRTKAFQLPMKVIKDTDAKQHVDIYSILYILPFQKSLQ